MATGTKFDQVLEVSIQVLGCLRVLCWFQINKDVVDLLLELGCQPLRL